MSDFPAQLRQLRAAADLTQERLAELAGCSTDMLRAVEAGRRRPSAQLARRLAEILIADPAAREALVGAARRRADQPAAPAAGTFLQLSPDHGLVVAPDPGPPPLIGRAAELAALDERLADPACRLLTVVGPGGMGKTSLATHAARRRLHHYPDGLRVAMLAAAPSPAAALSDLAALLRLGRAEDLAGQIVAALRGRRMLLLLDNLEHLLDGPELPGLLVALLEAAPGVQLLATSRRRIGLQAEWVFQLDGLAAPRAAGELGAAALLFAERARRLRSDFALTPQNYDAVARICQIVGGTPLAIELAAAWVGALSPAEIADEIGRDLDLLSRADRDAPERHRSVRAVFEGSWRLLPAPERRALAALSLFQGGFGRAAAAEVAGADLRLLASLIQASLVRRDGERYSLHELIRQYAAEQLGAEGPAARRRFLDHWRDHVGRLSLRGGAAGYPRDLGPLSLEIDNLRAALQSGLAEPALGEPAARLCADLRYYWYLSGMIAEGLAWASRLDRADLPADARAALLLTQATLARHSGDRALAQASAAAGMALGRPLGGVALADAAQTMGAVEVSYGDPGRGRDLLGEALAIWLGLGVAHRAAQTWNLLATAAWEQGDEPACLRAFQEGIAAARALDTGTELGALLLNSSVIALARGEPAGAEQALEAMDLMGRGGDLHGVILCVECLAGHAGLRGDHRSGGALLGATDMLRQQLQMGSPAILRRYQELRRRLARGPLDDDAWAAALAAGRSLDLPAAVALARAVVGAA